MINIGLHSDVAWCRCVSQKTAVSVGSAWDADFEKTRRKPPWQAAEFRVIASPPTATSSQKPQRKGRGGTL